ncbi:MAG: hypothetical protein JW774_00440 [Candidatus Aureabacteria bacterium]|nr:hypothetical protein [Candidatus Auribacterota bacterium]
MRSSVKWLCLIFMICSCGFAEPLFKQNDEGTEFPVDYSQYGEFKNMGTSEYEYVVKDDMLLAKATGDGIFPNNFTIYYDPAYKQLTAERRLQGSIWDLVNTADVQACYIKWAIEENEEPGVKQFYIAHNLERAGLLKQAVKAYYACVVHFPRSVGWTYWMTPWYVGPTCINIIEFLLREHPEIGCTLVDADIFVENGFDNDVSNDIYTINPGTIVKTETIKKNPKSPGKVVQTLGGEYGKVVQYENGDWQFMMEGRPVLVKSISYQPEPVGQSYDEGTMADWMKYDTNENGLPDSPLEAWVDKNGNNVQDPDEPNVGDFQLMKEMGTNCIRLYHHSTNKELLKTAYEKYGLYSMMGDLLGMYCVGSGAAWDDGTDYTNEEQKKNMLESVKKMVEEYKDEPYVCMWVLGNENNYGGVFGHTGGVGNAGQKPNEYYAFVNEAAKWIKSVDKNRPVAICNGDLGFLNIFARQCPDVDIYGINAYRGKHGFGRSLWYWVKKMIDRPAIIMEYGCPAFHEGQPFEVAFAEQMEYDEGCWKDIEYNSYLGEGAGNAIGGVLFQWVDGWAKSGQPPRYSPSVHETIGQWPGPFPSGWSYEEWFGICGHGNGTKTPMMRVLRPAYYKYKELWNRSAS